MIANTKLLIAFAALLSTAISTNPIWLSTSYPVCNSCLDNAYLSCSGDYRSVNFAICLCAGEGSAQFAPCVGICDAADKLGVNLGSQKVGAFYNYCTQFFKELCPAARPFFDSEQWEEFCGPNSRPDLAFSVTASMAASVTQAPGKSTTTAVATVKPSVASSINGVPSGLAGSTTSSIAGSLASSTVGSVAFPIASSTPSIEGSTASPTVASTARPSNTAVVLKPLPIWSFIIGMCIQISGIYN